MVLPHKGVVPICRKWWAG